MIHTSTARRTTLAPAKSLAMLLALTMLPAFVAYGAELAEIVERVEPSVVRIDTDKGLGSGVIVGADGLVVTNYHVIEGSSRAKATLRSGAVANVTGYVAVSPTHDLAVLRIEKPRESLKAIAIADTLPRKGIKVAAFGNPIGLSFSTSEGIVSAIRKGTELSELMGPQTFQALGYSASTTWIQTTAAISGGNSGGPLVDMDGNLLGLNTWSLTSGQNLNFAIGAPDIKQLINKSRLAVSPLSKLPARRTAKVSAKGEKFKLEMPSGHVFSPEIFTFELRDFRGRNRSDDEMLVVKHGNGSLAAMAEHQSGILHGRMISFHQTRDPMLVVGYSKGLRNGPLTAWNEAGKPLLFSQYSKGKRQGFCCLFESGELAMIAEFDKDKLQAMQLMNGNTPLKTLKNEEEIEKDETAPKLLKKLAEVEATTKTNELALKRDMTAEFHDLKKAKNQALRARNR